MSTGRQIVASACKLHEFPSETRRACCTLHLAAASHYFAEHLNSAFAAPSPLPPLSAAALLCMPQQNTHGVEVRKPFLVWMYVYLVNSFQELCSGQTLPLSPRPPIVYLPADQDLDIPPKDHNPTTLLALKN